VNNSQHNITNIITGPLNNLNNNINNGNYISLPYFPLLNKKIENVLKPHQIKIADRPLNQTKKFFTKLKPNIPKLNTPNTIYKINCNNCNSSYIGQSKQYLRNRINNHINDVKKLKNSTALSQHALDTGHKFNFNEAEVLDIEPNFQKRIFKEMIYIKKNNSSINFRTDIEGLSNFYHNLINLS
jgi:hypothetical protein